MTARLPKIPKASTAIKKTATKIRKTGMLIYWTASREAMRRFASASPTLNIIALNKKKKKQKFSSFRHVFFS